MGMLVDREFLCNLALVMERQEHGVDETTYDIIRKRR